jgi:hypothetical protein
VKVLLISKDDPTPRLPKPTAKQQWKEDKDTLAAAAEYRRNAQAAERTAVTGGTGHLQAVSRSYELTYELPAQQQNQMTGKIKISEITLVVRKR